MQTLTSTLQTALESSLQKAGISVTAEWANTKSCMNPIIFSSSDYYSRMNYMVHKPLAYYRFKNMVFFQNNTVVSDFSGNNNHAKAKVDLGTSAFFLADPGLLSGLDGTSCKSFRFSANNGGTDKHYIECPTVSLNNTFQVEAWVYPTTVDLTRRTVVASANSTSETGIQFHLGINASNKWTAHVAVNNTGFEVSSSASATINTLYHLIMTVDGMTLTLYVNGVSQGTATLNGSVNNIGAKVAIGRLGETDNYYFRGLVGEVAIYNKVVVRDADGANVRYLSGTFAGTDSAPNYLCNAYNLLNDRRDVSFPWAVTGSFDTTNNVISANGDFYISPLGPGQDDIDNYNVPLMDDFLSYGWRSRTLSDISGSFTNPEYIVMYFDTRTATDIEFYTSPYQDQVATISVWYRNTSGTWVSVLSSSSLTGYSKVVSLGGSISITGVKLKIEATVNPYSHAFVQALSILYKEDISADVVSATVGKVKEDFDSTVPLGSTAANTLDITLENVDKRYSALNKSSPIYQYITPEVRMNVSLTWATGAGTESVVQGVFFTDDWQLTTDMTITAKLRDRSKYMQDNPIPQNIGIISEQKSAGRAVTELARYTGVGANKVNFVDTYDNTIKKKKPEGFWRLNGQGKQISYYNTNGSNYGLISSFIGMPTTTITVEFWFKTGSAGNMDIVNAATIAGTNTQQFKINLNAGTIQWTVRGNSISAAGLTYSDNMWHHLRCIWDSVSGSARIYFDDASVQSGTISAGLTIATDVSLAIGAGFDTTGSTPTLRAYIGQMAEFRVWNSYNTFGYQTSNKLYGDDTHVVGVWPLDEGSGKRGNNLTKGYNNFHFVSESWTPGYLMVEKDTAGTNLVTWVQPPSVWTPGPIVGDVKDNANYAPVFNGATTYGYTLPGDGEFDSTLSMTWEVWCNPANIVEPQYIIVKDKIGSTTSGSWALYIDYLGIITLKRQGTDSAVSTESIVVGQDNHIVITIDGSNVVSMYLNGVAIGVTDNIAGAFTANELPILFGRPGVFAIIVVWTDFGVQTWAQQGSKTFGDIAGNETFNGTISSVAFYDRVLTASEVAENYLAGKNPDNRIFSEFWSVDTDFWSAALDIATADLGMFYFEEDDTFTYETMDQFYSSEYTIHQQPQYILSDLSASDYLTYDEEVLLDVPWLYWKLDEASGTLADTSGFGNTGTAVGSPTYQVTKLVQDTGGFGMGFTNANMYFQTASTFTAQTFTGITIEAWYKPTVIPTRGHIAGFDNATDIIALTNEQTVIPGTSTTVQTLKFTWTNASGVNDYVGFGTKQMKTGNIYHIVAVHDGSRATIYVNGEIYATKQTYNAPKLNSTQRFYMGNNSNDTGRINTATIDNVTFYNLALTQDRVKAHYLAGLTAISGADNLVSSDANISLQTNKVTVSIAPLNDPNAMVLERVWEASQTDSLYDITLSKDLTSLETGGLVIATTNTPFNAQGYLRINDEIIKYENYDGTNTFTKLTRGQFNTIPTEHYANTVVFEARKYNIQFDNAPLVFVKDPFISAVTYDKRAEINYWKFDSFGATLVVSATSTDQSVTELNGTNPLNGIDNFFVIDGIPAVASGTSTSTEDLFVTATALNDNNVKRIIKELKIDNKYITDRVTAQNIANFLIDRFQDPVPLVNVETIGLPHLQLGDRVRLIGIDQFNVTQSTYPVGVDYFIMSIEITYDGGVKQNMLLRRVT